MADSDTTWDVMDTPPVTKALMGGSNESGGKYTGHLTFFTNLSVQSVNDTSTSQIGANSVKNTIGANSSNQPSIKSNVSNSNKPTSEVVKMQNFFPLWITSVKQDNRLSGIQAQSQWTRHFYPRSYGPGDYVVEGIARSQVDYQHLAKFIRNHHEQNMVSGLNLVEGSYNPGGRNSPLMILNIPSEQVFVAGWIARITLSKLGVFEPVPKYTFNFTIAWEKRRSKSPEISRVVRAWYSAGSDEITFKGHDNPPDKNPGRPPEGAPRTGQ